MDRHATATLIVFLILFAGLLPAASRADLSMDIAANGDIVFVSDARLHELPVGGIEARPISGAAVPASRPRLSADGRRVVYESRSGTRTNVRLLDPGTGDDRIVDAGPWNNVEPAWHPSGERIVFASARRHTGFDIWEHDLATGLSWRVSTRPGDERDPAWSANGRDLVYVHRVVSRWSLVLRRHGQPERVLVHSNEPLAAPAWRPDGSLVSFVRRTPSGPRIDMVILASPPLERTLVEESGLAGHGLRWRDRANIAFASGGMLRERDFNSWRSQPRPFRAATAGPRIARAESPVRVLPVRDPAARPLVVRAGRIWDGIAASYRHDVDVLIEDGVVTAIEGQRPRPGRILVDMSGLTLLPGLIDSLAALPDSGTAALGPAILASGVTMVVAEHDDAADLDARWAGAETPGPRLLVAGPAGNADAWLLMAGDDADPATAERPLLLPDFRLGGVDLFSGFDTPGADWYRDLLASRQARILAGAGDAESVVTPHAWYRPGGAPPALASAASPLPPGIALQAQLRGLVAAGAEPRQALAAAGVNAARGLGLGLRAGRIAPGAVADLLIVDGDPLADIDAALAVIGVVRNGRFFSTARLLEMSTADP